MLSPADNFGECFWFEMSKWNILETYGFVVSVGNRETNTYTHNFIASPGKKIEILGSIWEVVKNNPFKTEEYFPF